MFPFILISIWPVSPEFAIGVMIIAAAPGGVSSNILNSFAKGDVALSISLTAIISIICIFTVIPKKESFIDVDTKYLIKKKPVSFKCYKDHEEGKELINPGNVILPDIHFSSFTDTRVLNFDKFK